MATSAAARVDGIEVLAVATVLIVPFLFALALPAITDPAAGGRQGVVLIAAVAALEVPLAAVAVWAVRRRGDTLASIGVVRPHPAWVAVAILVAAGAAWLIWQRHTGAWAGAASSAGAGGGDYTTAQQVTLVALGVPQIYLQELLYRGFAITFLERMTGSLPAAVLISSVAFALAHITSLGGNLLISLFAVFATSVLLSLLYAATRDLTPVFVIHWAWVAWLVVGLSGHTAAEADTANAHSQGVSSESGAARGR